MRWLPGTRILTAVVGGGAGRARRYQGPISVAVVDRIRAGRSPRTSRRAQDATRRGGRAARGGRRALRGCGPCTAASTRRSERRIVSMRPLKSWRSSWIDDREPVESICASGSSSSCRRTRSIVKPLAWSIDAGGAVDEADLALELPGQQLVGRHLVDLGQAQQPRHRDRPLAPLVGAEDRRLELEGRACFDVVKRQALLTPNRSESLADACSRRRHLLSPLARLFATCVRC